jgi:hypothetical protein
MQNPMGNFGEGYDQKNYGTNVPLTPSRIRNSSNSSRSSRSSSSRSGIDPPFPPTDDFPPVQEQQPEPPPIPSISYRVMSGRRVDFTNGSLNAVRYEWDFGTYPGGSHAGTSTQKSPTVFYNDIGGSRYYTVTLRAYNADGDYAEATNLVFVEYIEPVCDFTYVVSGTKVSLTNISTCPFGEGPQWSYGDLNTSGDIDPIHDYGKNGTFTIRLTMGQYYKEHERTIDAELILDCDDVAGARGYKWELSANGIDGWYEFADTAVSTVAITQADHGVDASALNYFRVRAYNAVGDSGYSDATNVRCGI